jgi:uncharacterized protein (DUF2141 family)
MKRYAIPLLLAAAAAAPAFAEDVTITLNGVEPRGGKVLVALQTEDQFLKAAGAYGEMIDSPAAKGPLVVVLKDVAPGAYSLSVLHDVNGDGQMQMTDTGMPAEGWAMKGGADLRGPPEWAGSSFTVGSGPVAMTETMIYP